MLFADQSMMRREACRICGRVSVDDDGERCRQSQMASGEYECPGDAPHDQDENGFFLYLTPEGEAEQGRQIDAMIEDLKAKGKI